MNYDIIGDIHGHSAKLEFLLTHLGYRHHDGAWRHASRCAVFVGDFVDRGPGQIQTLEIVRDMIDAGSAHAVMGNHEFNAIAWHTKDPLVPGAYLRKHTDRNRHQHQSFLDQVGEGSTLHDEWVQWFYSLPLWIETDDFRVVHACWHPEHMANLTPLMGPGNTLTPALVEAASRPGRIEFTSLEAICKGLDVLLPSNVSYEDEEGTLRTRSRVRWWDENARTYRAAAMVRPFEAEQLPDTAIPDEAIVLYDQKKPLFFGHYWLSGTPQVISPRICCVDYSAARADQPLVAYQWNGEQELTNTHFVSVLPDATIERGRRPV